MKTNIYFFLIILPFWIPNIAYAQQIPQAMNYEAVATDRNGEALGNKDIVVEISILKGGEEGELAYKELHSPRTDLFGLFQITIGEGIPLSGGIYSQLSEIDWEQDDYFIKTSVDFGTSDVINGLVQTDSRRFLSVPYSFRAERALLADSVAVLPQYKISDLTDVDITGISNEQILLWDADSQTWKPSDPGSGGSSFLRADGSTDLTADWTISNNSVILQNGNINLLNGTLFGNELELAAGLRVNEISSDSTFQNASHQRLASQQAIKYFVDSLTKAVFWAGNEQILYTQNTAQDVGIGTDAPAYKLHVSGESEDAFVLEGVYGGNSPNTGSGTRMAFYPAKAAFRAGRLLNQTNAWDNANTAVYSAAFGLDNTASGAYAFSAGKENSAQGEYASVFGFQNDVSSDFSFVSGESNLVTTGAYGSNVFGKSNSLYAQHSFAVGQNNRVLSYNQLIAGRYNKQIGTTYDQWVSSEGLFILGNGSSESNRSNAFVVLKDGSTGIALGESAPGYLLQVGKNGDGSEAAANEWVNFSDARYKTGLQQWKGTAFDMKKIKAYTYYWKNNPEGRKQIGFTAQEVEQVFPELVYENEAGYKAVNYVKFVPILWEEYKSQQNRIEDLEQEVELLKKSIEAIKQSVVSNAN